MSIHPVLSGTCHQARDPCGVEHNEHAAAVAHGGPDFSLDRLVLEFAAVISHAFPIPRDRKVPVLEQDAHGVVNIVSAVIALVYRVLLDSHRISLLIAYADSSVPYLDADVATVAIVSHERAVSGDIRGGTYQMVMRNSPAAISFNDAEDTLHSAVYKGI